MPDVVLCRRFPFPDVNDLVAAGCPDGITLRWLANDATPAAARAALTGVDVLLGAWVTGWPFAAGDFRGGLKLVQLLSSGYESVDMAALAAVGIPVANIGTANASTVAEHALALILALLRRLPAQVDLVRGGGWRPAPPASELRGRTVGIVGLGGIGREIARRAVAFDTTVRYTSRHRQPAAEAELGVTWAPLGELLATSDVVCLAVPVTPETTGLIGAAELGLLRPSAVLVNVSRGALVDEPALAAALASGAIAGAGLDVLAVEPPAPDNPLLAMPNVLVTPHQAGLSPDAWPRIVTLAWSNVVSALAGGDIAHRIA